LLLPVWKLIIRQKCLTLMTAAENFSVSYSLCLCHSELAEEWQINYIIMLWQAQHDSSLNLENTCP
jgi:hypothetical protein